MMGIRQRRVDGDIQQSLPVSSALKHL